METTLQGIGANRRLEARRRRGWRPSFQNESLGDKGPILYRNTWFDEKVYQDEE